MATAELIGGPCDGRKIQISFTFFPPKHLKVEESGSVSGSVSHVYETSDAVMISKEGENLKYIYVDSLHA